MVSPKETGLLVPESQPVAMERNVLKRSPVPSKATPREDPGIGRPAPGKGSVKVVRAAPGRPPDRTRPEGAEGARRARSGRGATGSDPVPEPSYPRASERNRVAPGERRSRVSLGKTELRPPRSKARERATSRPRPPGPVMWQVEHLKVKGTGPPQEKQVLAKLGRGKASEPQKGS